GAGGGVAVVHGRRCQDRCGLVVFFFQAEDGIRDRTVTGVQTCALPILEVLTRVPAGSGSPMSRVSTSTTRSMPPVRGPPMISTRSEERRVGKECRSRWSPDHWKKEKQEHN